MVIEPFKLMVAYLAVAYPLVATSVDSPLVAVDNHPLVAEDNHPLVAEDNHPLVTVAGTILVDKLVVLALVDRLMVPCLVYILEGKPLLMVHHHHHTLLSPQ